MIDQVNATYDHELVKRMIEEAVKAEREACAKICDEFSKGNKTINYSDTIAICIRARTKQ